MKTTALDASGLPEYAFGSRDPMFWGVAGLLAIESTMIALVVAGYFYVRSRFVPWPPSPLSTSSRIAASLELMLVFASIVPTERMNRAALRSDLFAARRWLVGLSLLGLVLLALRAFQFDALAFRWDANAYASMFYGLLGLQTLHLVAGVGENVLFVVLMFRGPIEKKFMVDVHVNGVYWYFVVAGWFVSYLVLYVEPWLGG